MTYGWGWVMGFFLLMILAVMSYLLIIGEFLEGGALPIVIGVATELGITVHDLAFGIATLILVGVSLIIVPLIILIVRLAE